MLVSSPSGMQRHQRQHRRQNSIPVALEAVKTPNPPGAAMHRYSAHKRGMSLDQPPRNLHPTLMPKKASSMGQNQYTNVLRETQQQHTSHLNQHPYLDNTQVQMMPNTDGQRLETTGLNVYTNQYSNENIPANVCMNPSGLNIKNANTNPKNRHHQPAVEFIQQQRQQQQQPCPQENMAFAHGLENQLINEGAWNPYVLNQSMLAQVYDLRRASVQSEMSHSSYIPSTPPKQVQSSTSPRSLKKKSIILMKLQIMFHSPRTLRLFVEAPSMLLSYKTCTHRLPRTWSIRLHSLHTCREPSHFMESQEPLLLSLKLMFPPPQILPLLNMILMISLLAKTVTLKVQNSKPFPRACLSSRRIRNLTTHNFSQRPAHSSHLQR